MPELPPNDQEASQAGQDKPETEVVKVHDAKRGVYTDTVRGTTRPLGKPSLSNRPFRISGQ